MSKGEDSPERAEHEHLPGSQRAGTAMLLQPCRELEVCGVWLS